MSVLNVIVLAVLGMIFVGGNFVESSNFSLNVDDEEHFGKRFALKLASLSNNRQRNSGQRRSQRKPSTKPSPPKVFTANPAALQKARASHAGAHGSDATLRPALDRLFVDANKALSVQPPAVTDKRQRKAPSGDQHDFVSQASYYWPDPKTGSYERRDGHVNPASKVDADDGRLFTTSNSVSALSLAYYVGGDEKYAKKATQFLRRFFLNATTAMNPNLNYGQMIPGKPRGRKEGIIHTRRLVDLVDAVGLLEGSKSWTAADGNGMRRWMESFLDWLLTSDLGKAESKAANNHGSFYDAQTASLALFVGRKDQARRTVTSAAAVRLDKQIQPDGRQPLELARSRSLQYSVFNLEALINLASLGRGVGVDLWSHVGPAPGGRSLLEAGLSFLAPYVAPDAPAWPNKLVGSLDRRALAAILLRGASHYPALKGALFKYERTMLEAMRERLLFVTPPLPKA